MQIIEKMKNLDEIDLKIIRLLRENGRMSIQVSVPPEKSGEFYDFIKKQECVLEGDHITGEYSMLLKVIFPSTTMLDEFMGKLQQFGKTETSVVFSTFLERP